MLNTTIKEPETIIEQAEKATNKQIAYGLLRKNGLSVKNAAESVGYNPKYAYTIDKKVGKYDLTDSKLVSQAHKVVKNIMKGKTWGSIETIKDSTALAAAESILDRHQPKVKQSMNLNVNADISPVDLSKYRVGG